MLFCTARLLMDKFYTNDTVLQHIATLLQKHLIPSDYHYIDFSCGENHFASLLPFKQCTCIDIDPPTTCKGTVTKQDWFSIKPSNVITANYVIGLNPPFGNSGSLAKKFVQHAFLFEPDYLVLILPKTRWTIQGYRVLERVTLEDASFHLPCGKAFQWPTTLWILKRDDTILVPNIQQEHTKKSNSGMFIYTRKMKDNASCIAIRRAGRSAGKQTYIIHKNGILYYDGKKFTSCKEYKHKVEGECFLKITFHCEFDMYKSKQVIKDLYDAMTKQRPNQSSASHVPYISLDQVKQVMQQVYGHC
jgi:hypothetical protein